MEQTTNRGDIPVLFLLKTLLFSYILTGVFLALLAFLLYKVGLTEAVVSIAIIVIYVAATFFAGFMAGKKLQSRKFLWGLLMGSAYFLVLAGISLVAGEPAGHLGDSTVTTLVLCAAGGMLGGMLS
ncbi:MAG: TIGR04086 family membrane protein [Eubacterium sp.]|nr:TIGR04086 family membrane protein [Eubacterium sp.]MCM1215281.1 TIGR04086 family membrane protein [Lachnospiraceae bacterium]MCM1304442.1 TIGR04086 family membrane protein [Butyrivibrio sp.]MCM1343897.1 TIGR04086 family membrane protein [Muribaculaceae bacterium]MCM1240236.1 TIGR04086 family membrane protein [Lachnospiraceae bacterium]